MLHRQPSNIAGLTFDFLPCPWTQERWMDWNVYLAGEIHSAWRQQIIAGAGERELPVTFTSPVTNHEASDAAGDLLGAEDDRFWRDHRTAKINAIRTRTLLARCDLAVVRFADQYKQWNAAFDAGYCAALGKPYITLHDAELIHPLKEVDASAMAWARTPAQVVEILDYVIRAS
jgi:YtoQ family protein